MIETLLVVLFGGANCCVMLCCCLDAELAVLLLQEYFSRIMKKLKEVGATADRTNFYV